MRGVLHVIATLAAVPYVLLAAAGAALAIIVALHSGPLDLGQLLFLVPCALACGVRLATSGPQAAMATA